MTAVIGFIVIGLAFLLGMLLGALGLAAFESDRAASDDERGFDDVLLTTGPALRIIRRDRSHAVSVQRVSRSPPSTGGGKTAQKLIPYENPQ